MFRNKLFLTKNIGFFAYALTIILIVLHAMSRGDYIVAVISAICGITYTVFAGYGTPVCYLFGITGSGFYIFLSFQNALWGNLLLYLLYYIPMQILGFFKWREHLKQGKNEIVKISISKKESLIITGLCVLASLIMTLILYYLKDTHPILDGITTVVSIGGMYLTVKRALEQWVAWMVVNALSLVMWLKVALSGERVYSTVMMWAVYLFLAFYFYFEWKKEINSYGKN